MANLYYYHYTDPTGYNAILKNPTNWFEHMLSFFQKNSPDKLRPSLKEGGDAFYGNGWYFTDMAPEDHTRTQIASALWDRSFKQNMHKTDYYLKVEFHHRTKVLQCRSHVVLVPITSKAEQRIIAQGSHPEMAR